MQQPFPFFIGMARQRSYTGNFSGVQGRFDVNLEVDNREFIEMLERLKYTNLVKSSDIRKVFARVAKPVKLTIQQAARSSMRKDPRKAWKGVRVITLKGGLGVVVGLLNPRNVGKAMAVPPKPTGGRSGIRRKRTRSARTNQLDGYLGADRSFILRMHNQGTTARFAGTRDGKIKRAYRGQLTAKRFFDRAESGMKQASKSLVVELEKIIEKKSKEA